MALIERFMGLGDDSNGRAEGVASSLPLMQFKAAFGEVILGNYSRENVVKTFSLRASPDASGTSDISEMLKIISKAPPSDDISGRLQYLERVFWVLCLAQRFLPEYATPTEVRKKLGIEIKA